MGLGFRLHLPFWESAIVFNYSCTYNFIFYSFISLIIQLFRERLSEKVHATIPKGIVGGFEFTVLQIAGEARGHVFASAKGK